MASGLSPLACGYGFLENQWYADMGTRIALLAGGPHTPEPEGNALLILLAQPPMGSYEVLRYLLPTYDVSTYLLPKYGCTQAAFVISST